VVAVALHCGGSSSVLWWQQLGIVVAAALYCSGSSSVLWWQQLCIVVAAARYCGGSSSVLIDMFMILKNTYNKLSSET
jgi:hypothetical protein